MAHLAGQSRFGSVWVLSGVVLGSETESVFLGYFIFFSEKQRLSAITAAALREHKSERGCDGWGGVMVVVVLVRR